MSDSVHHLGSSSGPNVTVKLAPRTESDNKQLERKRVMLGTASRPVEAVNA